MWSQHKTGSGHFPSYTKNCVQKAQRLYSPRAHQTHLICHWGTAAETTFTLTQNMHCVLTNCTRTSGPHIERVIHHTPDGLFPPWSGKVQHRALSIMYSSLLCPSQWVSGRLDREQTPRCRSCSFWNDLRSFNMALSQPRLELWFPWFTLPLWIETVATRSLNVSVKKDFTAKNGLLIWNRLCIGRGSLAPISQSSFPLDLFLSIQQFATNWHFPLL